MARRRCLVCGGANGGTFANAPASELCAAGDPTVVSGAAPWTWSCLGRGGGADSACGATADRAPRSRRERLQVRERGVREEALPVGQDEVGIGGVDGGAVDAASLRRPGEGRWVGALEDGDLARLRAEDDGRAGRALSVP